MGMGMGGPMGGMEMMRDAYMGRGMGMGMGMRNEAEKNLVTLTRTDFLIQFVWQPPKPEEAPKDDEEKKAKLEEITKQLVEAQKNSPVITIPKEKEIETALVKQSQEVTKAIEQGATAPAGGAPAGPGGTAPGGAAAPAPKTGVAAPPPAAKK
jgi:type IV pilus assembly protein PilM